MKTNLFFYLSIMLTAMIVCSCDEHEPLDNNIYVGFILTDDHQAVSLQSYEAASKNNAVGVIFATHTAEHPMLAVMLNEMQDLQFSDSLGFVQGTSADITSYDGFVNTASLQNTFDEKTGHGSPLADAVFRYHHYGQSDYIPSVSEMRLLVNALPVVNPVIERLHGTPISQSHADCWYWTSTEVEENRGNQAWLLSAANGAVQETPKDEYHPARAIVALNYQP